MIDILKYLIMQLLIAFYDLTSFKVGDVDLGQQIQNSYESIVHSRAIHILEIILFPIAVLLFYGVMRVNGKMQALRQQLIVAQEDSVIEAEPKSLIHERWQEINNHLDSINESEWKFAVIEADTIVDTMLRDLFPGETMGERLMNIDKTKLLSIDGLWEAHKIRNRLAHDPNYFMRHAEAVRAIKLFEITLKEIGAL